MGLNYVYIKTHIGNIHRDVHFEIITSSLPIRVECGMSDETNLAWLMGETCSTIPPKFCHLGVQAHDENCKINVPDKMFLSFPHFHGFSSMIVLPFFERE